MREQLEGGFARMTDLSVWEKGRIARGSRCRVLKSFTDSDGDIHPVGEEWVFAASMYSPYDEMLLVGIRMADGREWAILLHDKDDAQSDVIDDFTKYVTVIR